ncbi:MAG: AAA family ATPase, partial [Candidatus Thiodiazotropha sp. (ex Rostrolucina anterorostrata)]|nr:AAA family ATPase [Candidatus Thiodiazotropha sp. (ex Rostrolucina anterorostrata)]
CYMRIVKIIGLACPSFDDFELAPSPNNEKYIHLNWKNKSNDYLFGPHQLSDGVLRFTALATLFLQPMEKRPSTIIIDEPELGRHLICNQHFCRTHQICGLYNTSHLSDTIGPLGG